MGSKPKNAIYLIAFRVKKQLWKIRRFSRAVNIRITIPLFIAKRRVGCFNGQLLHDDALAGHFSRHGQTDIRQHGGSDICQTAALAQLHIAAANSHKGAPRWWCVGEGVPSGFIILLGVSRGAAVMKAQPPAFSTADHHLIHTGIHSRNGLDRSIEHAGWPTISQFAKFRSPHRTSALDALDALGSNLGGAQLGFSHSGDLRAGITQRSSTLVGSLHAAR